MQNLSQQIREILNTYVVDGKLNFKSLHLYKHRLQKLRRIIFIGSGNEYSVALAGASCFEALTDVVVNAYPSGEFRFLPTYVDSDTLLIAIAKTGEEIDTVSSIKRVKSIGGRAIVVCNNAESTASKMANAVLNPIFDGFNANYFVLSLLSLYMGARIGVVTPLYQSVALKMADMLAGKVATASRYTNAFENLGNAVINSSGIIVCGRGMDYSLAVETCYQTDLNILPCQISQITCHGAENKTILAIISSKDYLDDSIFYLNEASKLGASILIFTTDEVAELIENSNGVVALSGSLSIFNPIIIASTISDVLNNKSADISA